MAKKRRSDVQFVDRDTSVLKSSNVARPERGVGELSRELGLRKSTISRLMSTLERGGLLARSQETKRYRPGIDLISLAAQVASYMDVREVARPVLRQLAEVCQETVNLAVLDTGQVIDLDQFVPRAHQVKSIGWGRWRMPLHCTAAGKVLLAHLPQEELEQTLPL